MWGDRSIFTTHRKKYGVVRRGKSACQSLPFTGRVIRPSWRKRRCIKIYLADTKELSGLNIVVLKALHLCLLIFSFVTASSCQLAYVLGERDMSGSVFSKAWKTLNSV